ncbi:MAG: hypothetical protein JSW50_13105 [Candidatus Latescibacterota bacterium]|nr:MAG: hypothetical protein JSW50_13105 [Candidatus Latescibacterota bacterium]
MRKLTKTIPLILIATMIAVVNVSGSYADIILDTAYPVEKQSTRVRVVADDGSPVPNAAVSVTYRPGSAVPAVFDVGRTAADGNCEWTPREAGIVTISAAWVDATGSEQITTVNASVKYSPTPVTGIVIMIVAGIVLIGGAFDRISRLLRTPESG